MLDREKKRASEKIVTLPLWEYLVTTDRESHYVETSIEWILQPRGSAYGTKALPPCLKSKLQGYQQCTSATIIGVSYPNRGYCNVKRMQHTSLDCDFEISRWAELWRCRDVLCCSLLCFDNHLR